MCLTCGQPTAHKCCSRACYYAAERKEVATAELLAALNTLPSRDDVCRALAVSERTLWRRMADADIQRIPGTRAYAICRNAQWAWI